MVKRLLELELYSPKEREGYLLFTRSLEFSKTSLKINEHCTRYSANIWTLGCAILVVGRVRLHTGPYKDLMK